MQRMSDIVVTFFASLLYIASARLQPDLYCQKHIIGNEKVHVSKQQE